MRPQVIHLHRDAPDKPAPGDACNGCGWCCALETCPLARLLFWRKAGPCPALLWKEKPQHYRCGLLTGEAPTGWLPTAATPLLARLAGRWIAAGQGCDCDASPEAP